MKKTKILLIPLILQVLLFSAYAKDTDLSAIQLQLLKTIKVTVIAPLYLPKGYSLEKVEAVSENAKGPGQGNHYNLTYSNLAKRFSIETISGGVGDIPYQEVKKVQTKFGTTYIYYNDSCLQTSWLEYNKNFYKLISGEKCGYKYKLDMHENPITVLEAEKILKSLTLVK